jgi:S1-C subfamily serine protease
MGALSLLAALVAVAAGCGGSTTGTRSGPASSQATTSTETSTEQLIAKVKSGIIRIQTTTCDASYVGTGFVVGPRLVATVEHVVDGAAAIVLKRNDKVLGSARVIGEDPARDLALLETTKPISGYRFSLARRSPQLAEQVVALGFPFGLPLTVTQGSVSGLGRSIPIANVTRQKLVQTDAALNPGNSGGPLLATDTGQVIGLVDLGTSANGTSFAVSAGVAGPLLQAWRAAPQPVPLDSCGGLPIASGGNGSSSGGGSSSQYGYVQAVARILGNSSSVLKQLVRAVSEAHSNPAAAQAAIAAVVAARRDELALAEGMAVPNGAGQTQGLLVNAFSLSLASDSLYQRWINTGSPAALKRAQANDNQATGVKASFLHTYNRLRQQVGLAPIGDNFRF